ncbi:MAG: hypothetical protein KGI72_05990 [Patescibacteria group bacterium]|nr:hypothetical protein [Patescibacteria group bacterium]
MNALHCNGHFDCFVYLRKIRNSAKPAIPKSSMSVTFVSGTWRNVPVHVKKIRIKKQSISMSTPLPKPIDERLKYITPKREGSKGWLRGRGTTLPKGALN